MSKYIGIEFQHYMPRVLRHCSLDIHRLAVAFTSRATTNHVCCPHPCSLAVAFGISSASTTLVSSLKLPDSAQLALFFKHAPHARLIVACTPRQCASVGPCLIARNTVSCDSPAFLVLPAEGYGMSIVLDRKSGCGMSNLTGPSCLVGFSTIL